MYYNSSSKTTNAKFIKCRFYDIDYSSYGNGGLVDAQFINCKITNSIRLYTNCNASLINCILKNPYMPSGGNSYFNFQNCVIFGLCNSYKWDIYRSSFNNCIIYVNLYLSNSLDSTNSGYNNLCINTDGYQNFFKDIITNTNNSYETDFTKVFKDYTGEYSDDLTFELTDEAKQKYVGSDGKELGIYGGVMPFDATPSNPQITKLNVASKSTANGKLSVDITVKGLE